ncbi:WD40-repeat-containing domain protein [Myxozyma melibiosi]|uniref:WD40-repeat-containing domain protein n=1 Tax=Myxozyma melibiosi TaxID=54550 RepID=A0ABR1FE40_9ASCO
MISYTTWVPRGFAAEFPNQYQLDEEEIDRISKLAQLRLDDALEDYEGALADGATNGDSEDDELEGMKVDGEEVEEEEEDVEVEVDEEADEEIKNEIAADAVKQDVEITDDLREYDLENYDAEPEADASLSMFSNIKSLAYYKSNDEDPYIVLPKKDGAVVDDIEEEEREELQILDSDNLLLVAKTEDNLSHMEVYVYDQSEANLYVHHDILLPSFPLCVEWLNVRVGRTRTEENQQGSFAAIGTFEPNIEIWNLDVIDEMYPDAILGNLEADNQAAAASDDEDEKPKKKDKKHKKKKAKKPKKPVANDKYHVDAILALSANKQHRNILASGSADKTIKLWDLNTLTCARSYSFHDDKVCSLSWHPTEGPVLLTGSYDRTVIASDMRVPDEFRRWGVDADVSGVRWDPHDSSRFYVATESGRVHCFDARTAPAVASPHKAKPLWTLQAHDSEVTAFDVNANVSGLFVTGSTDHQVKVWNVSETGPSLFSSRDMGVGKVFSVSWLPDKPAARTVAVGGSNGVVQVWDTKTNDAVRVAAEDFEDEDEDDEE